jgi:ABC-type polysaccharide/polyol phosphate transport system ATPase subunit
MNLRAGIENLVESLHGDSNELPAGTVLIDSVSKRFRKHTLAKKGYSTVKTSFLTRMFLRRFPKDNYIAALQNVSVHVRPGHSLGLIGSNGSGKSTLLKLISGIYRPDSGRVTVQGRISALIELGAGFHPDFTGRENVYLGGVMYGLSRKQIDERFEDIVRYAELEDFIDDPVRTYSSGMYMRLGFSLAVHTEPDILIIDEVLAVGDAAFVHRCHETISEFKRQGKTLIFVTHDLDSVARWCDEAIWLDKGIVQVQGAPRWVIDSYLEKVSAGEEKKLAQSNFEDGEAGGFEDDGTGGADSDAPGHPAAKRWGNRDVEITAVRLRDTAGERKWLFTDEDPLTVEVDYLIRRPIEDLVFGIGILRADGLVVHGTNTDIDNITVPLPAGAVEGCRGTYVYAIDRLSLIEDSYYIDVAAHSNDGQPYDYHHLRYRFSVRTAHRQQGVYNPKHEWSFRIDYDEAEQPLKAEEGSSIRSVG